MQETKDKLFYIDAVGAIVTFICATLLHFSYEWSNGAIWSVMFGAVNESVWEHIKILTLPYICWTVIELSFLRLPLKKIIIAKVVGLYSIIFLTISVFYLYTSILGYSIPVLDIICAFLWILIGFIVSYKIIFSSVKTKLWFPPACFALILYLVMFISFTINPPNFAVFEDPITHSYGLNSKNIDVGAIFTDKLNVLRDT